MRKKSNIFSISRKYTKQEIEDMSEQEVNKELFSLAMSYTKEAIFNKSAFLIRTVHFKIKSVTLSRIVTRARKLQLKLFIGVNEPIYWSFIGGK